MAKHMVKAIDAMVHREKTPDVIILFPWIEN